MSHASQRFWKCYKTLTFCSLLPRCTIPCACHAKAHLNVQKCSVPVSFFALLTWKCASRHNGVHFFVIWTSKSGPRMVCFVHFDFEMCFAPQRRALFRHLNFQKCSGHQVFCAFWLANLLRATTACNFSSLIWPAGSAPAALASLLFDPPEPQNATNHWKNTVFRDFPTFSRICIFFLLTLLSSNLSLLSASSLLCFSSVHIVGSLTSKLPSTNISKYAEMCCPLCESYYTDTYKNVALLTFAPLRSKFVKIYEEKSKIKFRRVWLLVHTPDRPSQHTWPHPR